jgi:NodT family efflux transporter outer membrane factor (OMF) lipoprotein
LSLTAPFYDQWNTGFNLSWELDSWGRLRRAVASAEDTLEASAANYNWVLVTLQADVATNYVRIRQLESQVELVRENVDLQRRTLHDADQRFKAGARGKLDVVQARSTLKQTEAEIPQLQIDIRLACDRLCTLLGVPPFDIEAQLGKGPIPVAPREVAVGIPAELLRRRPDVHRAERQAAAQAEQIGIAEAQFYPIFSINGVLGYAANNFSQVFESSALNASVGPSFQWALLNYGRILNNMRLQDAQFRALVATYQQTVLQANAEVEDGLATFLRAWTRAEDLQESVVNAREAADIVTRQYNEGAVDFGRVSLIEQTLVQQENLAAQARGEIAQGLIQVYRALGGGWQTPVVAAPAAEQIPAPAPVAPASAAPSPIPPPPAAS